MANFKLPHDVTEHGARWEEKGILLLQGSIMSQFQQGPVKVSIILPNVSLNFACVHMSVGDGGVESRYKMCFLL